VGCGQNPKYHSYPVFEHVIKAADAACGLTEDPIVRFAALCHDLGKAPTRAVRPNGDGPNDVSFHNHEIVSTKLTYAFMKRMKFPKRFTEDVIALVRMHQYKYDRDWTDKAVRRFIRNVGITRADLEDLENHPQFQVRMADRMGNKLKEHLPVTIKQKDFQRRLTEVYENSAAHSLRDLKVNGRDIMEKFGVPPGPSVGKVIAYLFDAVETEPQRNNRDDLFRLADMFLKEEESGSNQSDRSRSEEDHADRSSSELSEGTTE
jgi:putative nucleotidyltransferase with HDIG domain